MAPQAVLSSSLKSMTSSTTNISFSNAILSSSGINGFPFFLVNHSSEFTPTINLSPNLAADFKYCI